jgi:hypothetical protein
MLALLRLMFPFISMTLTYTPSVVLVAVREKVWADVTYPLTVWDAVSARACLVPHGVHDQNRDCGSTPYYENAPFSAETHGKSLW